MIHRLKRVLSLELGQGARRCVIYVIVNTSADELDTKLSRKLPLCKFRGSECDFGIPPCAGSP
eukprot:scaffold38562_cov64-Cyclotella_meneghiniana.AAC.2